MEKDWKPARLPKDVYERVEEVQAVLQKRSLGKVHFYQAIEIAINSSSILCRGKP
jgi:hypothetical protein